MFVLHDRSRVLLSDSSLNSNKWSGLGCRWGGAAEVRGCSLDSNGQGAWAIRKSTIKDVVRRGNRVTNDFTDQQYKKVRSADHQKQVSETIEASLLSIRLHFYFLIP